MQCSASMHCHSIPQAPGNLCQQPSACRPLQCRPAVPTGCCNPVFPCSTISCAPQQSEHGSSCPSASLHVMTGTGCRCGTEIALSRSCTSRSRSCPSRATSRARLACPTGSCRLRLQSLLHLRATTWHTQVLCPGPPLPTRWVGPFQKAFFELRRAARKLKIRNCVCSIGQRPLALSR